MLKTKKTLYRIILVFNLICIAAALCACVLTLVSAAANIWSRISSICALVALVFAAFYILKGYGKDAARYFKLFALLFALSEFASLLVIGTTIKEGTPVLISGVLFAIVLFMAIGLDVGKGRSLVLCAVVVAMAVAQLVLSIQHEPGVLLGGTTYGTLAMLRNAVKVLLSCLFGIMVYAKYVDKKMRGTK